MAATGSMKYFLLVDSGRNPFPQVEGRRQALDIRKLNRREYRELPPSFQLDMRLGMDWILPDVLLFPFLLFSEQAKDVVSFYDPDIPWKFVALFDNRTEECASYFCPVLEEEDCILEEPYQESGEIRLDRKRMKGLPLFQLRVKDKKKTIIRMDLAESLLVRHAVGLELKEAVILCSGNLIHR